VDDDDGGFEAFVAARWAPLVGTAYLVTGDRGIAEDCVQEALVRMHRRWRRVNARGQVAYANRAVMNAALSWRRRRRVAEVPLNVDAHAPAQEPGDPTGFDPRLLAALWSLPPRTCPGSSSGRSVARVSRSRSRRSASCTASIIVRSRAIAISPIVNKP
jgi:DNA-directed RNA polymerase specialized sigma24 family protein